MECRLENKLKAMIEGLAREHQQELADVGTLVDLEKLTCQIGDMVTQELTQREVTRRAEALDMEEAKCPDCGEVCPSGELYRWTTSVESSTLVAKLDAAYHADPTLLHEAQLPTMLASAASDATLSLNGNVLTITPAQGFLGEFHVNVAVSDGIETAERTFAVAVTNAAPVLQPIADRTVSHTQDTMSIVLQASDADGDQLIYAAEADRPDVAVSLNANVLTINPAEGFAGEFHLHIAVDDGIETTEQTFAVAVTNAAPVLQPIADRAMPHTQDAMSIVLEASDADGDQLTYTARADRQDVLVSINGNLLTIDPADGFAGEFHLHIAVDDGIEVVDQRFAVVVANAAPVLTPIADQTMSHVQDTTTVVFEAFDANGDELTYTARTYRDDVTLSLVGNVLTIDPAAGFAGRFYVYATAGDLLTYTADSYGNNVTLSLAGNVLTIDPVDGFVGWDFVSVTASDGIRSVGETFGVRVTNSAPVLAPIGEQAISHNQDTLTVVLDAFDADGDQLSYTAQIAETDSPAALAYNADQELGLNDPGDYHEDYRGLGEKHLRGEDGAWYFILPSGELYRWTTSVESSTLVTTLDSTYHADPSRLHEARLPAMAIADTPDVAVSLAGNVLTIDPAAGFAGQFHVHVAVSDGVETVGQTFAVDVTNAAPVLEPIGHQTMSRAQDVLTIVLQASDSDGDQLSYTAETGASGVVVSLDGNVLTIDPVEGFLGDFEVSVTVSDGIETVAETFGVSARNAAPVLDPIGDQAMSHTQDTMTLVLQASDADGDELTYVTAIDLVMETGSPWLNRDAQRTLAAVL